MKRGRPGGRDRPPAVALRATVVLAVWWGLKPAFARAPDFTELTIEQLMNIEVPPVSKHPEPRTEAPAGQNLLQAHHSEFGGGTQVERGAFGQMRWQW
jgi:hypothetical protein